MRGRLPSDDQSGFHGSAGPVVADSSSLSMAARSAMVNRTHRVVRERAEVLQVRRSRIRSLWLPMLVCAAFLVILCTAVWSLLDQYELAPTGIPDASSQIFIFLLWFLPSSAAIMALAWSQRAREDRDIPR